MKNLFDCHLKEMKLRTSPDSHSMSLNLRRRIKFWTFPFEIYFYPNHSINVNSSQLRSLLMTVSWYTTNYIQVRG